MSNPRPPHAGDAQPSPVASDGRDSAPAVAVNEVASSAVAGKGSGAADDALAGLVYGRSPSLATGLSGGVAPMAPGAHPRATSAAIPFEPASRPPDIDRALRAQVSGYPAAPEVARTVTVSRAEQSRVFYPDDPEPMRQTTGFTAPSSAQSVSPLHGSLPQRSASPGFSPSVTSQVAPAERPGSTQPAGPSNPAAGSPVPPSGQGPAPAWVLPPARAEHGLNPSPAAAAPPAPVMARAAQSPPEVAPNERRWSPPSQEIPAQLMGRSEVPRNQTPAARALEGGPIGRSPGSPQLPSSRQIFTPQHSSAVAAPSKMTPSSPPGRLPAHASGFGLSVRTPAPSSRPSIPADEAYRAASQQHSSHAIAPLTEGVTVDFWTSAPPAQQRPAPVPCTQEPSYVYGPSASSLPRPSTETPAREPYSAASSASDVRAAGHPAGSTGVTVGSEPHARSSPFTPSAPLLNPGELPSSADLFDAFGSTLSAVGPETHRPGSQTAIPVLPPATWETRRPGSQAAIPVLPPATWETRRPGSQAAIPVLPPATWETRRPGSQAAIPVLPPATWETRQLHSQAAIPTVPPAPIEAQRAVSGAPSRPVEQATLVRAPNATPAFAPTLAALPTAREPMAGHAVGAPVATGPMTLNQEPRIPVSGPAGMPPSPAHEPTSAGQGIMRTASRGATNRAAAVLQPPTTHDFAIPGYNIIKLLGRGGMGEVYLAERLSDVGVTVPCVIKTILSGSDTDRTMRQLFLDEVRLVAALRHPNLVAIMDVGQVHERLYQTMEWVEGMDLEGMAERGSRAGEGIPLKHLLYLFREALQGLHYVHSATGPRGQPLGIVHRDISPGNILISRQGAVKIADFGVALMTAGKADGDMNLAGKPHYFAPELWKGSPASVQTDIFAMGVTFYEMLSLKPLFQRSGTLREIAQQIVRFDPRVLIENDLTIPEGVETLLMRSLAPNPQERYATALEFLEDVNDYAYEFGIRLLDAHFAAWVQRLLDGPSQDIRKPLFRG